MPPLEVCLNCDAEQPIFESARAAFNGGAERLELCAAMQHEGLTPTIEQIKSARSGFSKPGLLVMIRPRAGNFSYSQHLLQEMRESIAEAAKAGAEGVVFGVLHASDQTINIEALNSLLNTTRQYGLQTTFHRAFDATPNSLTSLETLIDLGVDRILTNGTRWGENRPVTAGIPRLKQLLQKAEGRIEIVIGGGVRKKNTSYILTVLKEYQKNISFHTYSEVKPAGKVRAEYVKDMVRCCSLPS